jgi:glycosyltransferase involved in cell wall biosynthesis
MHAAVPRAVGSSSFVVLANGAPGSPPASGLTEYLESRGARLTAVYHPLTPEHGSRHTISTSDGRGRRRTRSVSLPSRPPVTYPLDLAVPPQLPAVDGWFAFNNLSCARGLARRARGKAETVVYWAVDFVPDRFGPGSPMTRVFDALDAYCCRNADVRIDLSQAAMDGRDERHGLREGEGALRHVAPVGAWLDRVPTTAPAALDARRIVFIGHLVERMGGETVIAAAARLAERGVECTFDIAGRGPLEEELRADAERLGIAERVRFHGFISDHRALERLVASAAIALAPYNTRVESFTRFADPSKLKSYLAAGLPILVTSVPPNASEIAADGGAQIVDDDPDAFADAISTLLADRAEWERRRAAALEYRRQFDWNTIIADALRAAGFAEQTEEDI